ncbi:MAG: outer membrane protein assembly factor BamD [Proteobacteria bacterium]|nr:outer membrane protein assembly factor BamD [Pseudomonadota bacterium]
MRKNNLLRVFGTPALMLAVLSATPVLTSCEVKPISEITAEEGIVRLRGLKKDEAWERLIQEINEYKSRYPYSQYSAEADLLQADAFFVTRRYPESIANYDDFLRRNPSHAQADFSLYRIAKAYDLQSPEAVDREQLTALKAIEKYADLTQRFPKSSHIPEAQQRMLTLKRRLAEHHMFIGNFYWKKELWHASLTRFLYVAENFGEIKDLQSAATSKAADAYLKLAEQLEKNPKSDAVSFYKSTTPAELKTKASQLLNKTKSNSGQKTKEESPSEG